LSAKETSESGRKSTPKNLDIWWSNFMVYPLPDERQTASLRLHFDSWPARAKYDTILLQVMAKLKDMGVETHE
jgi:hypothetical protein